MKTGRATAFGGGKIDRAKRHGIDPLLIQRFRSELDNFYRAEKTKTELGVKMGCTANEMKRVCKHGSFRPFLRLEFPYLNIRSLQRYMEIARKISFQDYPGFYFAHMTHLKGMIDRYDFQEALAILQDNDVLLDIDENDKEQIRIFRGQMKNLSTGNMGFQTPSEEEKDAKVEVGPGGWTIDKSTGDPIKPDSDVKITKTVNSTDLIPIQFLGFMEELYQDRDDTGARIEFDTAITLLNISAIISKLMTFLGPKDLKMEEIVKANEYLERIVDDLDTISLDLKDGDVDEENDTNNSSENYTDQIHRIKLPKEKLTEEEWDYYSFKMLVQYEKQTNSTEGAQ